MKDTTGILIENEKQANRIVAKVMRITFAVFTFIYLLDVVGIFIVDIAVMTATYLGGKYIANVADTACKYFEAGKELH